MMKELYTSYDYIAIAIASHIVMLPVASSTVLIYHDQLRI